jgi:hypothetical protein
VDVIRALDAAQLVAEAALRDLAADPESRKLSAHGAAQVVQREVLESMLDRGECRIQRVDTDVQGAMAWVATSLRENVPATARGFAQRIKPGNDRGDERNRQRLAGLRAPPRQSPDGIRTLKLEFAPLRS